MIGSLKQENYLASSGSPVTYGNATISGNITSTYGNLYANNTSTSQFLTFINRATQSSGGTASYISNYDYCAGTFTVTGNVALIDILLVGAGGDAPGSVNGNLSGGAGGQVKYFSNVIVNPGTYTVSLGQPVAVGGNGQAKVFLTVGTQTANPGAAGATGGTATGGVGAGGSYGGAYSCNGGVGMPISDMSGELTWIYANGNPYFGAGGGGVYNFSVSLPTNFTTVRAWQSGGQGINAQGYSPNAPISTAGGQVVGAGKGAGDPGNDGSTGLPGSGVVIIRHRSS